MASKGRVELEWRAHRTEDRRVKGHLRKGHLRKGHLRCMEEGRVKGRAGWQAIALWLWSRMSRLRGALGN